MKTAKIAQHIYSFWASSLSPEREAVSHHNVKQHDYGEGTQSSTKDKAKTDNIYSSYGITFSLFCNK